MSAYAPGSAEAVRTVLATLPPDERLILPALQRLQESFGYVPDGAVDVYDTPPTGEEPPQYPSPAG